MNLDKKEKIAAVVGTFLGIAFGVMAGLFTMPAVAHVTHHCTWNCDYQSPTPTASPIPTEEPVCEVDCDTLTASPSATPEETVEPTEAPVVALAAGEAPQDPTCPVLVTPTVLGFKRLNPTSVSVWWSNTDPIQNYFVYFGLTANKLDWNVRVENAHMVTLNNLPSGEHIWVAVSSTDSGCVSKMSVVIDP